MSLGIDGNRMGLWACSGHVPNALSLLARPERTCLKCAALCYGAMLDLDGSTVVADAAREYGFANPTSAMRSRIFPGTRRSSWLARAGTSFQG